MSRSHVSRRRFLRGAAGVAGAALAGGCAIPVDGPGTPSTLARRPLGKLGVDVPILGMGTAAAGKHAPEREATALFDEAIDLGVDYMDTAPDFAGYGRAQRALGEVLRRRRDEVFLVTKTWEPTAEGAEKLLARNLEELQTDHADLVYAHSVGDDKMDPAIVTGKGGVLEFLMRAKERGLIRFVGISGHSRPQRFVDILERFDIDVVMCAVNFADRYTYDFEHTVFPIASRKGCGTVAMKVFGGERGGSPRCMMPSQYHDLAFRYALGLPGLSLAIVGMKDRDELRQNLERARRYKPLSEDESRSLEAAGRSIAAEWGPHFGPVT